MKADEFVDRVLGHNYKNNKRPIHILDKTKALCGFAGPNRVRDLSKVNIDDITCQSCLGMLKGN